MNVYNPENIASRVVELATEFAKEEGLGLGVHHFFRSDSPSGYLVRIVLFGGPNYEKRSEIRSEIAVSRRGFIIPIGYESALGLRVYRNDTQERFLNYLAEKKAFK